MWPLFSPSFPRSFPLIVLGHQVAALEKDTVRLAQRYPAYPFIHCDILIIYPFSVSSLLLRWVSVESFWQLLVAKLVSCWQLPELELGCFGCEVSFPELWTDLRWEIL